MATKKQKRLRGIEKAARDAEESRMMGLRAQREDHEMRMKRAKRTHEKVHVDGVFSITCDFCKETA